MPDGGFYLRTMESLTAPSYGGRYLPPICKFIEMYDRGAKPYPRQKTFLKIVFLELEELTDYDHMVIAEWMDSTRNDGDVRIPLDLYERMEWCRNNGYHHFNEIIYNGGRRGGKGFIGGKIAEYKTAQMIALGNPQRFYGIDDAKDIYLDVLATQYSQAQGMLYNDIKDAILMNDWLAPHLYYTSNGQQLLQTPADRARSENLFKRGGKSMKASIASIHVVPSAASATSIRGRASYMQCFDEFAHGLDTGSTQSSSEIYNAATPSLQQFDRDGLIYIPSSPWSKQGKFFDLYQAAFEMEDGHAANPQMLAIKIPSWGMYVDWEYDTRLKKAIILPPEKSQQMRSRERLDPEKFDVEFRANFAEAEDAYLQPKVVDSLFAPYPSEDNNANLPSDSGILSRKYRAHADAGRSQDNFCCAIGHKELCEDGYWHVFIDLMKVWQHTDFPEDERGVRRIDYTSPMAWFKDKMRLFFVDKFTMDQWNSAMFVDELRACSIRGEFLNKSMTVEVDVHTSAANFKRWEAFKTACYQGWVHIPWVEDDIAGEGSICLIERELKSLVLKNGNKVEAPREGFGHGDMADCVSTIVADLLMDQLNHLEAGDIATVVGAARGGYNPDDGSRAVRPAQTDWERQAMITRGSDYMAQMGYGRYR